MRLKAGSMGMPLQLAFLLGIGVSGISVALFGVLSAAPGPGQSTLLLGASLVCAMLCNRFLGYSIWHRGGLLAGLLNGIGIIAL